MGNQIKFVLYIINLYTILILCLCGCRHVMETEQQIKDKMQIAQGIIENIEANKLLLQDSIIIAQFDSISRPIDYAAQLSLYAERRLRNSNVSTFYPQPVSTQIDVTTDKIFYSNDSLKCAAFIVVDIHFDILPEFEDPKSKHKYEGFAIYGVRNSIDRPFKIYPINSLTAISRDSDVYVKRVLETAFNTKEIRDCGTAGTYMEKRDHKYWFGHEKFFEDSPDFKTDSTGVFWCEYDYHPVTKPVRKYFYSNRDR